MPNHYDLAGRVALVTGGASGIGAAAVERLRASGAEVHVFDLANGHDVRDSAQLNAAVGRLPRLDVLDLIARAITPPNRPRRFDARFFMADAGAVGRNHLDAGPRARPDVAVHVAPDTVGGRGRARAGNIELDESLAVAQDLAVHVVEDRQGHAPGPLP